LTGLGAYQLKGYIAGSKWLAIESGEAENPAALINIIRSGVMRFGGQAQRRVLKGQTHNVSGKALAPVLTKFFNAR
jgi:hypothetical protein